MGRILRWLGIGLAAAVTLAFAVGVAARLGAEIQRKYDAGDAETAVRGEKVWFFRMDPRAPA